MGVVSETPGLPFPTTARPHDHKERKLSLPQFPLVTDLWGNLLYFCHAHCNFSRLFLDNKRTRMITLRDKPVLPLQVERLGPRKGAVRSHAGIGRTRAEAFRISDQSSLTQTRKRACGRPFLSIVRCSSKNFQGLLRGVRGRAWGNPGSAFFCLWPNIWDFIVAYFLP